MNLSPIRKIVAGAIAAAVVYVARRLGLDLGPEAVNEAAAPLAAIIVGYLVKDPRVDQLLKFLAREAEPRV